MQSVGLPSIVAVSFPPSSNLRKLISKVCDICSGDVLLLAPHLLDEFCMDTAGSVWGECLETFAVYRNVAMWSKEYQGISESPANKAFSIARWCQAVVYFRNHCWAWWKIQDNSLALHGPQLPKCTQPIHHLQWPPPLENLRWHHSSQPVSQRSTYAVILTFDMQYFIIFYPSIFIYFLLNITLWKLICNLGTCCDEQPCDFIRNINPRKTNTINPW